MRKRQSMSEWITAAIVLGVMLILVPFYYFDRMDLAGPSLGSAAAIGLAIATCWKDRTRRWFWIAIAGAIALHVYAILHFRWSEKWASIFVIGFIALLDYGVILLVIKFIEIICRSADEAESQRSRTLQ